jgi:DNA-binding transcriptional regulator YiaG
MMTGKHMSANEIRAILSALEMTQGQAAEMLGVTEATIGNWVNERGDIPLAAAALLRLLNNGIISRKQIARASIQMPTFVPKRWLL